MICPKCGFEQPESPDCMRCGIVISRYKGGGNGSPPPFRPPVQGGGTVYAAAPASGLGFSPPAPPEPAKAAERKPSRETLFDPLAPVQVKSSRTVLLRPLDAGELLQESFAVYGSNAFSFTLLVGLALSPTLLVQAYFSAQKFESASQLGTSAILLLLASVIGQPLATAAVTFGVFKQMRGEDTTLGACLGAGISSLGRVLLVSLVQGVAVTVGLVLCIIPGVIMSVSYGVTVPAAVEEGLGPFEALRRSANLTSGYRWPIFRVLWILGMLAGVLSAGVTLLMDRVLQMPRANELVTGILSVVLTGITATASAVIYYRLRGAKEGVDVDQIASVFS